MIDQPVICEMSVVTDNLFKEVLFNAEGHQCAISYEKIKEMTMNDIISYLIDFFAESAPGYEGKMISIKLTKELRKTINSKIEQIK